MISKKSPVKASDLLQQSADPFDRACILVRKLEEEYEILQKKYHELLYAVGMVFPGETRHETALRYIQQQEQNTNDSAETSTNKTN